MNRADRKKKSQITLALLDYWFNNKKKIFLLIRIWASLYSKRILYHRYCWIKSRYRLFKNNEITNKVWIVFNETNALPQCFKGSTSPAILPSYLVGRITGADLWKAFFLTDKNWKKIYCIKTITKRYWQSGNFLREQGGRISSEYAFCIEFQFPQEKPYQYQFSSPYFDQNKKAKRSH